jgi:hypothetical protein
MISGPEPGALPITSRIGFSGNAACAACTADAAESSATMSAADSLALRIRFCLPLLSDYYLTRAVS